MSTIRTSWYERTSSLEKQISIQGLLAEEFLRKGEWDTAGDLPKSGRSITMGYEPSFIPVPKRISNEQEPNTEPGEIEVTDIKSKLSGLSTIDVVLPKHSGVVHYLESYPDLIDLLYPIGRDLRKAFGPNAELSLELYSDPEFDDQYLGFYVRLNDYAGVLDKIESVQEKYDEELAEQSGYLLITTDFHPPMNSNGF